MIQLSSFLTTFIGGIPPNKKFSLNTCAIFSHSFLTVYMFFPNFWDSNLYHKYNSCATYYELLLPGRLCVIVYDDKIVKKLFPNFLSSIMFKPAPSINDFKSRFSPWKKTINPSLFRIFSKFETRNL